MNYYDEILKKIYSLIQDEDYDKALFLVNNELSVAYIPKDVEVKLREYFEIIKESTYKTISISDEDIEEYLFKDENHQLIAVQQLNSKNLRDYLDLVNKYLSSNGYKNAKVLLIDSLIRQEIGEEIHYDDGGIEYNFIPKYVIPIEQSPGYLSAKKIIDEEFMKFPSECKIANELLYKQAIINLPINIDVCEANEIASNIIAYVNKAFNNDSLNEDNSVNSVLN